MQYPVNTWAEQVRLARKRQGLSRERLAALAGVTATTIWRIERGLNESEPRSAARIVQALGYTNEDDFFRHLFKDATGLPEPTVTHLPEGKRVLEASGRINVSGRQDETPRTPGGKPLPIYRSGACGDPRDSFSAPDPEDLEYPPIGKERLVGPHGFGVYASGESMANRDIHDQDIVWVNPDLRPRAGRVVLARVWDTDGSELGMVIKVWKDNGQGSSDLWGDGDGDEGRNPVVCSHREIIGPVVWIQPHGFAPH